MKSIAGAMKKMRDRAEGFTIVELTLVIIISTIMIAGMVGLVIQAFTLFGTQKDLEAVSESSRRILSAMARQMKGTLHVDDANTGTFSWGPSYGFWADIDYDNPTATSEASHYEEAERVIFYRDAATSRVMQHTDQPEDSPTNVGDANREAALGNYVSNLQFYYFAPGDMPQSTAPFSNSISGNNASVGSVIIVLTMNKGKTTRVYQQQVYLKITTRS